MTTAYPLKKGGADYANGTSKSPFPKSWKANNQPMGHSGDGQDYPAGGSKRPNKSGQK